MALTAYEKQVQAERDRQFYSDLELRKKAEAEANQRFLEQMALDELQARQSQEQFGQGTELERLAREQARQQFLSGIDLEKTSKGQEREKFFSDLALERLGRKQSLDQQLKGYETQREGMNLDVNNMQAESGAGGRGSYFGQFREGQNALIDRDVRNTNLGYQNYLTDAAGREGAYNDAYTNWQADLAGRTSAYDQDFANWQTELANRLAANQQEYANKQTGFALSRTAQEQQYANFLAGIQEQVRAYEAEKALAAQQPSGGGYHPNDDPVDTSGVYVPLTHPAQTYLNNVQTNYGITQPYQISTRPSAEKPTANTNYWQNPTAKPVQAQQPTATATKPATGAFSGVAGLNLGYDYAANQKKPAAKLKTTAQYDLMQKRLAY
jgi:hypothetical protein